jgi:hypothetical protein
MTVLRRVLSSVGLIALFVVAPGCGVFIGGEAGAGGGTAGGSGGGGVSGTGGGVSGTGGGVGGTGGGVSGTGGGMSGTGGGVSGTGGGMSGTGGGVGGAGGGVAGTGGGMSGTGGGVAGTGGGVGPAGTWTNVTPTAAGLTLGMFGIQTMMNDAARPSDFYFSSASTSGIFKSTDFGKTWVKISSTTKLSYGCAADPNPNRDPSTPLTLWCSGGYGNGVAKSTDSGVTWTTHLTNNTTADPSFANDPYALDVDPYDSNHLLAGFHGNEGLSESTNGGVSWTTVPLGAESQGVSLYPFFVDTGVAATTRGNWLTMSQWGSGGIFRTTNAGASWTKTSPLQHGHGNAQIFLAGSGVIYAAGLSGANGHGIYRSSDYGMTWTLVNDGTAQNGVFGTPKYVYADNGWASAGGSTQTLQRAPRATGTAGTWANYAPSSGLTNGSGHAAVSYDASLGKYVIVIGAWTAGIWRYVEP